MTSNVYWILCCVRVFTVFLPQTGYIHPDEHFQGPEIVYGDTLHLNVYKTWEFTSGKPIRNIVYPYLVVGFPSIFIDILKVKLWGITSFPYLLLIMPRIIMCCLSFIHDILLFKLCFLLKKDHKPCLLTFASSYITLVYLTRTFSNSLESLFFSFMIYLLFKFMNMKTNPSLYDRQCSNICFLLGVVLTIGIFNRPTFLCYAIFPIIAFVLLLLGMKSLKLFFIYFTSFCMGGLSILLSFTAIDSLYYNKGHFSLSFKHQNIVATPLNFILYNINSKNLLTHGLHSRWLHLFVNIPLLFSVYGIIIIMKSFSHGYNLFTFHLHFKNVLLLSFLIPLFLLSIIPHQEPRFILPLIFPLVLLYDLACNKYVSKETLCKLWYIQNAIAVLFFGFIHQGGIYTSASHIHSVVQNNTRSSILYFKTYMPPRYLLGLELSRKVIQVYDFGGSDLDTLDLSLENIKASSKPQILFVAVPHEVVNSILHLPSILSDYKLFNRKYIFPHLSMESPPDLNKILEALKNNSSIVHKLLEIKKAFSIHILTFTLQSSKFHNAYNIAVAP